MKLMLDLIHCVCEYKIHEFHKLFDKNRPYFTEFSTSTIRTTFTDRHVTNNANTKVAE